MRPEQPNRTVRTSAHLRLAHPDWEWRLPPTLADDEVLLLAHTLAHLKRLGHGPDFDEDTPYFPEIGQHARRAVSGALAAAQASCEEQRPGFSLMRPPGHHATADRAMGFCYFNQVAVAAFYAQRRLGTERVAIWDFDAHHGNGTEALVRGRSNILFASVHQSPAYPHTGTSSADNCLNWPVRPRTPRPEHMAALRSSLDALLTWSPGLVLVSAGFDAYARDPITAMSLEIEDFATLGRWLREGGRPVAAVLEGGYSNDLPLLVDAFLSAWEK